MSFSDTLRESKSENSLHSKNRGTRQKVAPKYILQNVLAIIVSSKMCLIECVFIVDEREELIFEYTVKPSSPTYSYVHKQLLRIAAGNSHIKTSDFSSSQNVQCFSPDAIMDSVLEIDSKWRVAWNMVDKVYLIAVGRIEEKYVDAYSDEEDDEEDTVSEEDNKTKGLEDNNEAEEENQYDNHADKEDNKADGDQGSNGEIYNANANNISQSLEHQHLVENQKQTKGNILLEIPEGDHNSTSDSDSSLQKSKVSMNINPVEYFDFFKSFSFAAKAFLETRTLTPAEVTRYSYRLVFLLQVMIDGSSPYITDFNQLRELLPNDSIFKRILSTTRQIQQTASKSIQTINQVNNSFNRPSNSGHRRNFSIFEKSGNMVPWREANLKYTQNEMFVDLVEKIDYIIPRSGSINDTSASILNLGSAYYELPGIGSNETPIRKHNSTPIVATINGQITFNSSLSGMPKIQLALDLSRHNLGVPMLHRCVDLDTWVTTGHILEFIPPNEKFTLMEYRINLLAEADRNSSYYTGLVNTTFSSGLGLAKNVFVVNVHINSDPSVKFIDDLSIDIHLPASKAASNLVIKVLRITQGSLELKSTGEYCWVFDKQTPVGMSFTLRGEIKHEGEEDIDPSSIPGFDSSKVTAIEPMYLKVEYQNKGSVPTGISVKSLSILSGLPNKIKPYKGVKYTTITGDVEVR